jgi:hypothetical protein
MDSVYVSFLKAFRRAFSRDLFYVLAVSSLVACGGSGDGVINAFDEFPDNPDRYSLSNWDNGYWNGFYWE